MNVRLAAQTIWKFWTSTKFLPMPVLFPRSGLFSMPLYRYLTYLALMSVVFRYRMNMPSSVLPCCQIWMISL